MLDFLDKYKFGIVAVFATYMVIFVYSNATTFIYTPPVEPFFDQARIIDEEEQEITPEDVEIPDDYDYNSDVKNVSQNAHDDRQASNDNFSENRSPEQIAQDIKALEAEMKNEAGGSQKRAELQRLIEERKEQKKAAEQAQNDGDNSNLPTSENKAAGATLVYWDLNGRKALNNNDNNVGKPGYTCNSSGVVVIDVKTNINGNVVSAKYNAGASRGANQCMINNSLRYARKSRFAPSSESKHQTGYIKYTFVLK